MRTELEAEDGKIIWQARFLSREYLPEKVVCREEQKRKFEVCVAPTKEGQAPLNAWMYGPAGTGKTVLARTVVKEVCEGTTARFGFYVNCWERRSLYSVVQAMAESLRLLRADAQDTNVKLGRIKQVIKGRPVVVILDDIDRVAPSERERIIHGLLGLPCTGVVCISNEKKTLLSLEERTKSRLSPMAIAFERYRPQEIEGILFDRVKNGLTPDSWTEEVLTRLARGSGGDARAAVEGLRQAAVAAESAGKRKVSVDTLPDTLPESAATRREEMESGLSYHERLIYKLALKNEPILTTELRRIYHSHCQKDGITSVARRTFSKYVKLLGDCGLVAVDQRVVAGKGRLLRAPAT